MTEMMVNEGEAFPQHHTVLEEDRSLRAGQSHSEAQASVDPGETVSSATPQRNKFSVDDGLRAMKATALAVEQSFRLTDAQEAAIQKCFQLIREDTATRNARMLREKSKRSLQVYDILRSVREILGLPGLLLCALALTPKKMHSMTKADATNFPYILRRWWQESSPSSERLEIIAEQLKSVDEQIPYIPLAREMDSIKGLLRPFLAKLTDLTYGRFASIHHWSNV